MEVWYLFLFIWIIDYSSHIVLYNKCYLESKNTLVLGIWHNKKSKCFQIVKWCSKAKKLDVIEAATVNRLAVDKSRIMQKTDLEKK